MDIIERFLTYVSYHTTSDEESPTCPSTARQKLLGKHLADELNDIGLDDAWMDDNGYVWAHLPANDGTDDMIGLVSHMDTAPSAKGDGIKPRILYYEGGDIELDPQSIFLLVEALDPILLAIADEKTARLVAQAYRTAYDLDAPARVFGRPTAVFRNLAELVSTDEGKQKAWRVLKAFPKR